jgi:RNA polymerase sigma factor (sigma-70 family)
MFSSARCDSLSPVKETQREDWAAHIEALANGDAKALGSVTRFVTRSLARWNAYDFESDWDDLVQETILATAVALREGRIRERGAVAGYLQSTARFLFIKQIKLRKRQSLQDRMPWEEAVEKMSRAEEQPPSPMLERDLDRALDRLPTEWRAAVVGVYVDGRGYSELSKIMGTPLGTLKGHLQKGLKQLRLDLRDFAD